MIRTTFSRAHTCAKAADPPRADSGVVRIDSLPFQRLVCEMTYNVLMGTLNPTHSLTHSLTPLIPQKLSVLYKRWVSHAQCREVGYDSVSTYKRVVADSYVSCT